MRVLVTGGAGFIGSHFAKRLAAAGDDVVVLDKLTYAGNPREPRGRRRRARRRRHLPTPTRSPRAAAGCDAIVNFAAETHVDRSILGADDFIHTNVFGTHVLLEWAREQRQRASSRSRPTRSTATSAAADAVARGRPLRPSSPYSAAKAGGDLQVLGDVRTYGVERASITRGVEHLRAEPVSGEAAAALRHERARRGAAAGLRRRRQMRDWLHVEDHCAAIELVLREGRPARSTTSAAARSTRTCEVTHILAAHRRGRVARPPRRGPRRPRPPLCRSTTRSSAQLGWAPRDRARGRARGDRRLVPRQPLVVGADQVGRVIASTTSGSTRLGSP